MLGGESFAHNFLKINYPNREERQSGAFDGENKENFFMRKFFPRQSFAQFLARKAFILREKKNE